MFRIILPILLMLSLLILLMLSLSNAKRTVIHTDDAPAAIGPYS